MSRERDRIAKKREQNPIEECNKIQRKFYPQLFQKFEMIADTRHSSYITYTTKEILTTLYYKAIGGIGSMQKMTREFNEELVVKNLYKFMGSKEKEYLPHGVTINEFLEKLEPKELENIQKDIVYQMIRRKTFDNAKVLKRWLVLIDGTELDEGKQEKNKGYLSRTYHKGEEKEFTRYHRSVLEAKLYFGNDLVCSVATEWIENTKEYQKKKMTEEAMKQDCETKAFVRLAKKIKKKFQKLPIIIVADGLYVSHRVIEVCKENGWEYLIRYKEGSAPSIEKEYQGIPEKEKEGGVEYINGVLFGDEEVNVIKYEETKIKNKKEKTTHFAWITSIELTKRNGKKIVEAGRNRWKIENQGFNRQKRWQGNLEHACSHNQNAQKNHYLMEQIADFMKQLYEYFYLKKNEIKKEQKNISSELLKSFGQQTTIGEDIFSEETQSVTTN
ncbi:MAG: transposase family protein [Eubacteriales bacterium]